MKKATVLSMLVALLVLRGTMTRQAPRRGWKGTSPGRSV